MKFTKEEISLCKQVVVKHQKEIKYGDWYYYSITKNCFVNAPRGYYLSEDEIDRKNIIPLWTISDCLEFLRERGLRLLGIQQEEDEFSCGFCETDDLGMRVNQGTVIWRDGETPLEACLKAVLAVLEERK